MISQNTKRNIQLTFERLKAAYANLNIANAQDYFLTLGNVNEIHLIKKDASASVFLGKLFLDENSTQEIESKRIWKVLENYFRMSSTSNTSDVVKTKDEPKRTSKRTKKVEQEVEIEPEVMEADEDSDWVDTVL